MKCEIVFRNDYFVSIRLCYGVLVNIYKCKLGKDIYKSGIFKKLKKLDSYTYKLKEDISYGYESIVFSKGNKALKESSCTYRIIEEVLNKKDWFWELKTTGNCFSGNTKEFESIINIIKDIIDKE